MNNINNQLIDKQEIENLINRYVSIYYNSRITDEDPFKLNKYIFEEEKRIKNIKINNIELIQKAFIHKSFWNTTTTNDESDAYSCLYLNKDDFGDYEKLEFRGDKVIDIITLDYITEQYPDKEVGFLTELKSNIVRKPSLASLGEKLGFKKYILFSSHIDRITNINKNSGRENTRFLEDIFESFIGALYIDQDLDKEVIKPFLLGVYKEHIDLEYIIKNEINYKSALLKFFHSQKFGHPKYTDLYFIGPPTNRTFVSILLLENKTFFNEESVVSKNQEILDGLSYKTNGFIEYLSKPDLVQLINSQTDQHILKNDKNDVVSPYQFIIDKVVNDNKGNAKYILVGVGFGPKKQDAEKSASKECLLNFRQLP